MKTFSIKILIFTATSFYNFQNILEASHTSSRILPNFTHDEAVIATSMSMMNTPLSVKVKFSNTNEILVYDRTLPLIDDTKAGTTPSENIQPRSILKPNSQKQGPQATDTEPLFIKPKDKKKIREIKELNEEDKFEITNLSESHRNYNNLQDMKTNGTLSNFITQLSSAHEELADIQEEQKKRSKKMQKKNGSTQALQPSKTCIPKKLLLDKYKAEEKINNLLAHLELQSQLYTPIFPYIKPRYYQYKYNR